MRKAWEELEGEKYWGYKQEGEETRMKSIQPPTLGNSKETLLVSSCLLTTILLHPILGKEKKTLSYYKHYLPLFPNSARQLDLLFWKYCVLSFTSVPIFANHFHAFVLLVFLCFWLFTTLPL